MGVLKIIAFFLFMGFISALITILRDRQYFNYLFKKEERWIALFVGTLIDAVICFLFVLSAVGVIWLLSCIIN